MALVSVWMGLSTFLLAVTMLAYRPAMTDVAVWLVLWLGSPGAMCLGGLVLWAHRKDGASDAGLNAQRLQCKVAIGLAILAAGIVYYLIINAEQVPPGLLDASL